MQSDRQQHVRHVMIVSGSGIYVSPARPSMFPEHQVHFQAGDLYTCPPENELGTLTKWLASRLAGSPGRLLCSIYFLMECSLPKPRYLGTLLRHRPCTDKLHNTHVHQTLRISHSIRDLKAPKLLQHVLTTKVLGIRAGQCRPNPWSAVPDWTLMPEYQCRTEAADYRKKCRCRTNFSPAFRL
jgi:hypothetical protein